MTENRMATAILEFVDAGLLISQCRLSNPALTARPFLRLNSRSTLSLAIEPLKTRSGARFALKYALIAGGLFAVYAFPFELFGAKSDWLAGYLAAYARLAGAVLSLFEPGIVITGAHIDGRFPMQIVRNCDAIEINILFVSAVLAFPSPWRRRGIALAVGLPCLVAINVMRICVLYFVGVHSPQRFAVVHEQIFPLFLVVAAALAFLLCANYLAKSRHEAA